jgi:hypothetical protein
MDKFGLIIQVTTAGSGQEFVSPHLDASNPEIKSTLIDERTLASQLGNLSDVYSVQITKNYKVYSLIVTNLTDFIGRSGFFALRLYGPKGVNLTNFESILATIKDKYKTYTDANNLGGQNYDSILSGILIVENTRNNYISLKNTTECYYYFDADNSALSTVFNTKGVNLVHKIYAFNKNKAVAESVAVNHGLKAFTSINPALREITVHNRDGALKELKINGQNVDFNPNAPENTIICQNSDEVTYSTIDDKTLKPVTGAFLSVERKYAAKPQQGRTGQGKKGFSEGYAMYAIMAVIVLVLGFGCWYFFIRDEQEPAVENTEKQADTAPTPAEKKDPAATQSKPEASTPPAIAFVEDADEKDAYKTSYDPKLEKYRFKYDSKNKKWSYKNKEGRNKYVDFYKENLDEIIVTEKLDFDAAKRTAFLEELKKTSGKEEVKNKPEKAATAPKKAPVKKPATGKPATPKPEGDTDKIKGNI